MPANYKAIVDAYAAGQYNISYFRKNIINATGIGFWFDLAYMGGNPTANFYASTPMQSTAIRYSTDGGIYHNPTVSPYKKYLRRICWQNVTTAITNAIICDYLMYYPFIDMSVSGAQSMTAYDTLPRYTDGEGVKIMPLLVATQTGNSTFRVTYTNQDGTSGRVTPVATCSAGNLNGYCVTSSTSLAGRIGPFITLQGNDTGVRSIESIEFLTGDTALITLVLVKPLAEASIYETTACVEIDYLKDQSIMPEIQDDAFINMICHGPASFVNSQFIGEMEFVWT